MTDAAPDVWISLATQVPLVIAFIYFSLRIIGVYQGAQEKLLSTHTSTITDIQNRHAKMIETIVSGWAGACDKRDADMRNFLQSITEANRAVNSKLAEDLRDNTAALQSLQIAITNLQIQVGVGNANPAINQPTRPRKQPKTQE